MQYACAILWSVPCPALQYFSHIISQTARFSKKRYWTQNVCFDFLYNFCLKHFSFREEFSEIWSETRIGLHVKCQVSMKLQFSLQIFQRRSNVKCHKIPSGGAELFHADGRTDMTKLIVAFRKFVRTRPLIPPKKTACWGDSRVSCTEYQNDDETKCFNYKGPLSSEGHTVNCYTYHGAS
jgi:hypothetical protein